MRDLLSLLPMLVLLGWAAVVDVRARRIPNWLTGTLILGGLVQGGMGWSPLGMSQATLGMLAGLGMTFPLFALGGMGAGDVKLFMGIGAWVGPVGVFQIFVVERIVGIVVVLVQAAYRRRVVTLLRGTAVMAMNAAVRGDLTCPPEPDGAAEKEARLPYAVPTLIAVVAVVATTTKWRWM